MTFLLETLRLGLANLMLHKLRSLLTALGIIIGVGAVIFMVAIGEGNKRKALEDIERLGARNIILRSIKPSQPPAAGSSGNTGLMLSYGLTETDRQRIEQSVFGIDTLVPLKRVARNVSHLDRQASAEVFGTTPALNAVMRMQLDRGRYLNDLDLDELRNVAVIGASVAARLFPLSDPLDSSMRIGDSGQLFKVVGVLRPVAEVGGAGAEQLGRDLDFDVHIPLTTAVSRFGEATVRRQAGSFEAERVEISELFINLADEMYVLPAADQIDLILSKEHAQKDDVKAIVPLALLEQRRKAIRMFNLLMTFTAATSLLVGGIGIMNIMLASVTERTREIGIRRAVGATRPQIVAQFLVETTMLSIIGGLIGVGAGLGGVLGLRLFQERFSEMGTPTPQEWSIVIAFLVSAAVGVIFGLYPAIKASRQDPIVALRHD